MVKHDMKKLMVILITVCLMLGITAFAEDTASSAKVYVFGDDWAAAWSEELKGYFYDSNDFVSVAAPGELLSQMTQKPEFSQIKKDDIVIISYGILEKDRPGDKNADFAKNLEQIIETLTKKGAKVKFASIASTMRYNTLTGHMEETRNFYTETIRATAKKKNLTYIDLAALTAAQANKLGSFDASRLYKSSLSLTENGNRMCAFEVYKSLYKEETLSGRTGLNLKTVHTVNYGEYSKNIDVFFEENLCDYFTIYTQGGVNVSANGSFADENGTIVCKSINGKINISFTACEKIQVSPTFRFEAKGHKTAETPFVGSMYPGIFDVSVQKSEALKASVVLNGNTVACNLDMPGTQVVDKAAIHTFDGYNLANPEFSVTVTGLTDALEFISFTEANTIAPERPRIFVAGDSTVCNYYPLERTGAEADGTVMTGWAMLLENYVDADVENMAASGYWAKKWQDEHFAIVAKEGKKGDLFIIQFGINDRGHSTLEEMTASLTEMIDVTSRKGMIPILVSPQISAGYGWGDESDIGKSAGGVYQQFFDAVRNLANEKGCFYVDLTDMSSGWFSEIGRDAVYKKYHLWNYEENKPGDMMHLSYKGADAMCRFFVTAIDRLSKSGQTDAWGNTLTLLKIW